MPAQVGRPEALGKPSEQGESVQERMEAHVNKTQPRGPQPAGGDRPVDGLEGFFAEDAVVAQAFDLDEPAIGLQSRSRAACCGAAWDPAPSPVLEGHETRRGPPA
jgi:hypothetical protein